LRNLNIWLISAAVAAATYVLTGLAVIIGRLRYEQKRTVADRIGYLLDHQADPSMEPQHFRARADKYLSTLTVHRLKRVITDTVLKPEVNEIICHQLVDRIGLQRIQKDALARARSHSPWERITALHILAFGRTEDAWIALEKALIAPDLRIVATAVTILGNLQHMRAAELLAKALIDGRYSASRISTFLDRFPIDLSSLIGSFLSHSSPNVRYWGAILLRRYPEFTQGEKGLASLTHDQHPQVRRAAIESLSLLRSSLAAEEARRLLTDEVAFVRAHAARALGNLRRIDAAPEVAALLADREWWVRHAAKVSLEAMGLPAIPHILPFLKHPDRFARNGSAEVLQNLDYFEQLLITELLEPGDPKRLALLDQLARAGGVRMSEAVINRLPREARQNASPLLSSLGVERNGGQP